MLITISGCSCTGKSHLANAIRDFFPDFDVIGLDAFAVDRNHLLKDHDFYLLNHDLPECYDIDLAAAEIKKALENEAISVPEYEHKTLKRKSPGIPKKYKHIIFEGLYTNLCETLKEEKTLTIHLECDSKVLLERRLQRDIGRGVSDIAKNKIYFEQIALPTFEHYGQSQKNHTDLLFDTTDDQNFKCILKKIKDDINKLLRD